MKPSAGALSQMKLCDEDAVGQPDGAAGFQLKVDENIHHRMLLHTAFTGSATRVCVWEHFLGSRCQIIDGNFWLLLIWHAVVYLLTPTPYVSVTR